MDYAKRLAEFAVSLNGFSVESDVDFVRLYGKWAGQTDVDPSARAIVYLARLCGIPTRTIPNIHSPSEWKDAAIASKGWSDAAVSDPARGDIVFLANGSVGVVVSTGQKISYVSEVGGTNRRALVVSNIASRSALIEGYWTPNYSSLGAKRSGAITKLSSLVRSSWTNRYRSELEKIYGPVEADDVHSAFVVYWQGEIAQTGVAGIRITGIFSWIEEKVAERVEIGPGDESDLSLMVNGLLYSHGFDPKHLDSVFDEYTEAALKAYQDSKGLDPSGVCTASVWRSLFCDW